MKKIILLAILIIATAQFTFAQNATIAKLKFEEAEEAYSNNNYESTIRKLDEVETLLNSTNPKILYLKINAQSKLINSNPYGDFTLLDNARKLSAKYLKDYETLEGNEEKYRDIYKISEMLAYSYPATLQEFENKIKQLKADKEEKLRAEQTQREYERAQREKKTEEERIAKANAEAKRQAEIATSQKERDDINKNQFMNLGLASGDIGKYGISIGIVNDLKKVGFLMTARTSFVSGKLELSSIESFNWTSKYTYTYQQKEKQSKSVIDLGPIFKVANPLWIYVGVGFGVADKYKLYKVNDTKTGTYIEEGYGSFEGADKMFFATSFAAIVRLGRVISFSAGVALVNFGSAEFTYGIAFNLLPN